MYNYKVLQTGVLQYSMRTDLYCAHMHTKDNKNIPARRNQRQLPPLIQLDRCKQQEGPREANRTSMFRDSHVYILDSIMSKEFYNSSKWGKTSQDKSIDYENILLCLKIKYHNIKYLNIYPVNADNLLFIN